MIFVTVGTHEQPFNRLIQKVDELKKDGVITEDVIIQTGFSTYEPKYCQWSKLIPYQQMIKNVADARIVITHGGPASFIMPLQIGKTPIVVPRQHQFNEHVNDHQVEFARNVAKRMGTIIEVEDIETLGDVITNYDRIVAGMPAYFCLSGVVFSMELKRKRYPSVWTLIVTKAKRLLAPMLFVWLVWNIPIKMLAGYYAGMNHPLLSAVMQIAFPNAVYLWFLEALFCCFVMDYIIIKYIKKQGLQFLIVGVMALIGLYFYKYTRQIVPFGNPFKWLIWFWLGHSIDDIRKRWSQILKKYCKSETIGIIFETVLFVLLYALSFRVLKVQWLLTNTILSFAGVVWIWELAEFINPILRNKWSDEQILNCSADTYGIYLWAEPLNYAVLAVAMWKFGIPVFGTEVGAAVIYFVRIFGSLIIAVGITKGLRKIKFPIRAY